jgi:hypothetical protein
MGDWDFGGGGSWECFFLLSVLSLSPPPHRLVHTKVASFTEVLPSLHSHTGVSIWIDHEILLKKNH